MSNKPRPKPRQSKISLPLIAVIAGGVVLLFAAILIIMGRSNGETGAGGTRNRR
jgi:hypothetical protein